MTQQGIPKRTLEEAIPIIKDSIRENRFNLRTQGGQDVEVVS